MQQPRAPGGPPVTPSARDFDVAVLGAGLVGSAIAYGLAGAGQRVAVLDEGDVAYRASRGNFALVWVQSKGLGLSAYAGWTLRSSNGWGGFAAQLQDETGLDVCFQRPGGFHLALGAGARILPVSIDGTNRVLAAHGRVVHEGVEIRVIVHEPIQPSQYGQERREELAARVRQAIASGVPSLKDKN